MNDRHLRVWFAVFVVAVFVAGVGGGLVADRLLRPPVPSDAGFGRGFGARGQPADPMTVMHGLRRDLELTAQQQQQLDQIFARRRARIQEIRREMQGRFQSEQREFRDEIQKILTPDQRKRFEQWLAARESMPGLRHMPGMGPGGGRGMGPRRGRGPGPGPF